MHIMKGGMRWKEFFGCHSRVYERHVWHFKMLFANVWAIVSFNHFDMKCITLKCFAKKKKHKTKAKTIHGERSNKRARKTNDETRNKKDPINTWNALGKRLFSLVFGFVMECGCVQIAKNYVYKIWETVVKQRGCLAESEYWVHIFRFIGIFLATDRLKQRHIVNDSHYGQILYWSRVFYHHINIASRRIYGKKTWKMKNANAESIAIPFPLSFPEYRRFVQILYINGKWKYTRIEYIYQAVLAQFDTMANLLRELKKLRKFFTKRSKFARIYGNPNQNIYFQPIDPIGCTVCLPGRNTYNNISIYRTL